MFWPMQLLSEDSRVHHDSNSQNGSSLGSASVHSHTPGFPYWLMPLQALALVTSSRLGLWHCHCFPFLFLIGTLEENDNNNAIIFSFFSYCVPKEDDNNKLTIIVFFFLIYSKRRRQQWCSLLSSSCFFFLL